MVMTILGVHCLEITVQGEQFSKILRAILNPDRIKPIGHLMAFFAK